MNIEKEFDKIVKFMHDDAEEHIRMSGIAKVIDSKAHHNAINFARSLLYTRGLPQHMYIFDDCAVVRYDYSKDNNCNYLSGLRVWFCTDGTTQWTSSRGWICYGTRPTSKHCSLISRDDSGQLDPKVMDILFEYNYYEDEYEKHKQF